jgi:protein-S-isoprenylcysteine O-methyltransferase Ste14
MPQSCCATWFFGHPALFSLLMQSGVNLFLDGTFSMTPHPFYQVFIIMAYDYQTLLLCPCAVLFDVL